ncbi:type II toxin-antitoxin system VapC family toxin [Frankia sp. CiP1_Cm_nod1]|uniref:type II toxin-antitoxin system VapC family toxin n=1 Tax=Frankia sp. CiP1_Cm_nod1 TaxID=2897160 RepID=UPI002024AA3B
MIALDTNVVSELMRARADPGVVAWVDSQPADEIYLTAVTLAELRYGIARLPEGRRRTDLADRLRRAVEAGFTGRVLPFDDDAAAHYADIVVGRERQGLSIAMADAQIAAICRSHSADLATRNTKDFVHTGIDLTDPWQATAD